MDQCHFPSAGCRDASERPVSRAGTRGWLTVLIDPAVSGGGIPKLELGSASADASRALRGCSGRRVGPSAQPVCSRLGGPRCRRPPRPRPTLRRARGDRWRRAAWCCSRRALSQGPRPQRASPSRSPSRASARRRSTPAVRADTAVTPHAAADAAVVIGPAEARGRMPPIQPAAAIRCTIARRADQTELGA